MSEIKQNLKSKGMKETFKNVRELTSGGLVIECFNEKQQKKLRDVLQDSNNFQLKENENTDPYVMITGIKKGYKPEEFVSELIDQNPDIISCFGHDVNTKLRYVTKRECRNPRKENWILQTTPDIFKWFIKNQNLSFDLIKEYFNIALCFKCCNFGHVIKYCTGNEVCFKCGQNHQGRDCTEETLDCPNCKRLKLHDRNHTARNPNCPAFLQKIKIHQRSTNYQTVSKEHFLNKI